MHISHRPFGPHSLSFASFLLLLCALAVPLLSKTITVGPRQPFSSIGAAMAKSVAGDTVLVEPGVYRENILMNRGTTLVSRQYGQAHIRAAGRGVCVTMGTATTISGFTIEQGSIGILSNGQNNRIEHCRIVNNAQSAIMCVGHLPAIVDNIIAFNRGSGLQGQDVRSTSNSLLHNTIVFNSGNGISLSGNSDIVIENSIIAFNEKADIAITQESARFSLVSNCLYRNGKSLETIPGGNISADPGFKNPRKGDFTLEPDSPCREMAPDRSDLGARVMPPDTMP